MPTELLGSLVSLRKTIFYLVTKKIVTKKRIRQIVKQLLSYKNKTKNKEIISDDRTGAKTFDEFFLNVVQSLQLNCDQDYLSQTTREKNNKKENSTVSLQ